MCGTSFQQPRESKYTQNQNNEFILKIKDNDIITINFVIIIIKIIKISIISLKLITL